MCRFSKAEVLGHTPENAELERRAQLLQGDSWPLCLQIKLPMSCHIYPRGTHKWKVWREATNWNSGNCWKFVWGSSLCVKIHLASDHFGSNSLRSEGCWKHFSEEVETQAPSHNSSLLDGLQGWCLLYGGEMLAFSLSFLLYETVDSELLINI